MFFSCCERANGVLTFASVDSYGEAELAYVKLDTAILDSTLWIEREQREVFITALLMADPWEARDEVPTFHVRTGVPAAFLVPVGWYGRVEAAGPGILRRAGVADDVGMVALERLASPDPASRSPAYDGRRLVRVDGGYVVLNYDRYREKDHGAAERARRWRERKKLEKDAGKA